MLHKPRATSHGMAESPKQSSPGGVRPWDDASLSAQDRYNSYEAVVQEKCEAILNASNRPGITEAERTELRLDPETQYWYLELKQLRAETPEQFCCRIDGGQSRELLGDNLLGVSEEMVKSYAFDKGTGVSTFTVPAGVTDVEAMKALNEYFRKNFPDYDRDAVYAEDLDWYENLPKKYPQHCQERDYSQARQITITGVVKGTKGENRTTQGSVLTDHSLVFSDPRDQALAAAIHACKYNGADLFKELFVRGSVPGFALDTNREHGACVYRYFDDDGLNGVAASGSPSPESK